MRLLRSRNKKSNCAIGCVTLIGILIVFGLCNAITSIGKTTGVTSTDTPTPTATTATIIQVISTDTPTSKPTPKPTARLQPTQPPLKPTPTHATCQAINSNPWCYNFSTGKLIYVPPSGFCNYFNCIPTFYGSDDPGDGYIVQCLDGAYSQSGGESGACSYHGGVSRPLYSH